MDNELKQQERLCFAILMVGVNLPRAELLVHSIRHSLSISNIQVFFLHHFSHCILSNHYSLAKNHATDSSNRFLQRFMRLQKFKHAFLSFFQFSFFFQRSEREHCGRFSNSFYIGRAVFICFLGRLWICADDYNKYNHLATGKRYVGIKKQKKA